MPMRPPAIVAPFAEGREVGIGFTVRNDAPIGMTILDIDVIRDGVLTPAALEPQLLTDEDMMFGLSEGVPFEPVEVPAGGEHGYPVRRTVWGLRDRGQGVGARQRAGGRGRIHDGALGRLHDSGEVPAPMSLALEAPTSCP